jgi:hypothetical protein
MQHVQDTRNTYKILTGKPVGKRRFEHREGEGRKTLKWVLRKYVVI